MRRLIMLMGMVLLLTGCGGDSGGNGSDGGNGDDGSNGGEISEVECGAEHTVGEYPKCLELGDEMIRCCLEDGESQSECERQAKAYLGAQCTGALANSMDPNQFCETALLTFLNGCP